MNYLNDYGVNEALNMLGSILIYFIVGFVFRVAY